MIPLKPEGFVEGKSPFVGKVVKSVYPCDCDICAKGKQKLQEMTGRETADKWHIEIQPLTEYQSVQHNWVSGKTTGSSAYVFIVAINNLGITLKDYKDLEGMTFEWEWKILNKEKKNTGIWIPVRHVTGKELEKYEEIAEKRGIEI